MKYVPIFRLRSTTALASLAMAGVAVLAPVAPAFAQNEEASEEVGATQEAPAANTDGIIVSGSRIQRPNLEATVPIASLTGSELLQTGNVSIGDRLALLPQFRPTFTSQNSGRFIGTAGLSILDLRGQGTARTLVLQNGMRHVTSQPGAQTVDVATIPVDLIERVDIITGGNSSIYGSDAIAGVVNFVLKRDFEGVSIRAQNGISDEGDGNQRLVTLTAGTNFAGGRGNVAVSLEYNHNDPIFFTQRDYAGAFEGRRQFQLVQDTSVSGPNGGPEGPEGDGIFDTALTDRIKNIGISTGGAYTSACPNSAIGTPRGNLNCSGVLNSLGTSQFGNVFVFDSDGRLVQNVVDRDFRPFGSGNAQGGLGSTLRETGLLQVGNTRYAANLLASFEVSEAFRPYFEGKFVRTESLQEGQPTFFQGGGGLLGVNFSINNPFLSAQARNVLTTSLAPGATTFTMQRFNIDFGGRGENHERELFRGVLGVEGNFWDTWSYNAAFNYGRVDTFYQTRGNVRVANYRNAVNAVRNSSGQIVCAINNDTNPANDDPACRPLNLFGLGAPSPEALDYILFNSSREQWSEQYNAVASISGDLGKLFELPGGPVQFALGGEWRKEDSFSEFDEVTRTGQTFLNAIGTFDPPTLEIWEAFGEIRIPLLADLPFFHELTIEGAARVSDYNSGNVGTIWSYNAGGVWAPVDDIRFRANYGRAVRAPTQGDLFGALSQTFLNGLADPCGQQNINANPQRVANCAAAGVPTTQTFNGITEPFTNRAASGISGLNGSNPNLFSEKSDSWTVGAVFQPSFLPGFTMSVDWYSIELSDAILTVGAQTVINQCYDDPGGINNQFCAAVFRNPNGTFRGQTNVLHAGTTVSFDTTGNGVSFIQGPFNFARQETSGIDVDLNYTHTFDSDWRLSGRAIVSLLLDRNLFTAITEPDRRTRERAVLGNPEWNAQVNLTLGYKDFDLLYSLRYLSKQTIGAWRTQNVEQGRPPENLDAFPQVFYPSVTYSDIRGSMRVDDRFTFFAGVDNLFDRLPPLDLLGDGAGSAIFPNMGRYFYAGFQTSF
ncbi:TonB-dependent receptor [Erythrobacter sp. sf7]|uniref:TonB-dependent receptor n=1 Tax=Erythrobacter fulvus TaxID=2987523 RepID=A0ABT5JPN6_9SPHN|nr:TonB-dependent receptor [Erythrobacter fulvus]MDC8754747.1 TonB-dependent receptor [Erythrobacter fulvus]